MCFSSKPTPPPPPPPPPQAPQVLEQDAPKLSDTDEGSGLNAKSRGFKNYKINKRNKMIDDRNKLGGVMQTPKSNV
jgi:hypothetical protein